VAAESWTVNGGGEANIEPLGTTLVIWQDPRIHGRIGELLDALRSGSGDRRTVTVDARWLMLNSDELDSLVLPGEEGPQQVNRERLAEFTRRPGSLRGVTNCLSSQLVYVVSGTMKNIVSGFIPVVGSVGGPDTDSQLASNELGPQIHFVSDSTAASNSRSVGYQPLMTMANFGALLEIRPTLIPTKKSEVMAVVDLKSTVTVAGNNESGAGVAAGLDSIAPAVDRLAVETQELITTLRVPLGKPVLVGGLTYVRSSANAGAAGEAEPEGASTELPQLYLVLEVR